MARIENLYLFAGNNEWEKTEMVRQILTRLSPENPSSVQYEIFEGKDKNLNPQRILSDLLTIPFGSYRVTLMKDIEKTPPTFQSRLLQTLTHLPKETVCILETKEMHRSGAFFEKVELLAKVIAFKEPKGTELLLWVDQRAAFYDKHISHAAKHLLLEKIGGTLLALDKALEALATYAGDSPVIEEKEVEALLGSSLTHTGFELAHAVASRKVFKALAIFSRLMSDRERPYEILGVLGWQLRRMLRAKELLEEGISQAEVGRRLRLRWQDEKDFFGSMTRFDKSEIERGLTALLRVDHHLKTGIGDEREEVERFVLGLCR